MSETDERPMCAKRLHFLDVEGATYKRSDGRTGCVPCKRSRAKRSRQRAKEKKETAERRAQRAEREAAKRAEVPTAAAVVPPGVRARSLASGENAARLRLAQMVRASRPTSGWAVQ